MRQFSQLVSRLGTSEKAEEKIKALQVYFSAASDQDRLWTIALFMGKRPRRLVTINQLQEWCLELTGFPGWLFEESYQAVGDLAETIALVLPSPEINVDNNLSLSVLVEKMDSLTKTSEAEKKNFILNSWKALGRQERFLFNKLVTGGFRINVPKSLLARTLAHTLDLEPSMVAHRLHEPWDPSTDNFEKIFNEHAAHGQASKPFSFSNFHELEGSPESLGSAEEFIAEWKWEGLRSQIIKRKNEIFVWSSDGELITSRFPEIQLLKEQLPEGMALDGEIIPFKDEKPLPFQMLQSRLTRKKIIRKDLEQAPAIFFAYDLLEWKGEDIRERFLKDRKGILAECFQSMHNPSFRLSPLCEFSSWGDLDRWRNYSRTNGSSALLLRKKDSGYSSETTGSDGWIWKPDLLLIDCVMVYAQRGPGKRGNQYSDYTFALRDGKQLVSFVKAYSGLSDEELEELDEFVKNNELERFGPVRTVKPELVFEISFEGISASRRHKSGVTLKQPRIHRWRKDKKPEEIHTLEDLKRLLEKYGQ